MDLFELENMAINAVDECDTGLEPSEIEITRWQNLFAYTPSEAVEKIKKQWCDYSRNRVSDGHWELVRAEREAQGFSREAYEHEIESSGKPGPSQHEQSPKASQSRAEATYIILLEEVLDNPEKIRDAAGLAELPEVTQATSETGKAAYCRINGETKQSIELWLSSQKSPFHPTFIRLSTAKKDLSPSSIHPTLGLDATLPQHRAPSAHIAPLQDEYPVWYFFYGTLADSTFLTELLALSEPAILIPASISRGVVRTWGGRYNALVDGAAIDCVRGSAYRVTSREREEALLLYETEMYEVVRCEIVMGGERVSGLTFRFAGAL